MTKKFYRVTMAYASGQKHDDAVIAAESSAEALENAQYKLDNAYGAGRVTAAVARVSRAAAADIVESGGIDWAGL
jgi:hypothetical protein